MPRWIPFTVVAIISALSCSPGKKPDLIPQAPRPKIGAAFVPDSPSSSGGGGGTVPTGTGFYHVTSGSGDSASRAVNLGTADVTSTLTTGHGGTGATTLAAHGVCIGEGAGAIAASAAGTSGQLLIGQGSSADPSFQSLSGNATVTNAGVLTTQNITNSSLTAGTFSSVTGTGTLTAGATGAGFTVALGSSTITGQAVVSNGGTGDSSLTAHGMMLGEGTSAVAVTSAGTSGQVMIGQGASSDPAFETLSGNATVTNAGVVTVQSLTNSAFTAGTFSSVTGVGTLTSGATGAGFTVAFGSSTLTGQVPVANGGTGDATLTAHGVLLGETTSSVAATAAGTTGQLLIGQGASADPTFASVSGDGAITNTGVLTLSKVNGTTVPAGGALTTGNACHVSGASACTYSAVNLAGGSGWVSGSLPTGNQAAQSMAGAVGGTTAANTISLTANSSITGILPVANGGTGSSSLTAHTVTIGEGTSAVAQVGPGTTNLPLLSGGASADPSFTAMPLASLSQSSATTNQVAGWNGSAWAAQTVIPAWTNLAAGGSLTISGALTVTYVTIDGTGTANTLTLPGSSTAVDGQEVHLQITSSAPGSPGAQTTSQPNVTIAPGTGNQISDPNNPGAIVSTATSVVVRTQGAALAFKYRSATVTPWTAPGWVEFQ